MAREDFSAKTRRVIAARAGFRCSYPSCRRLTVGPGGSSDTYDDTGKAAHILAASPGGPRGQGGHAGAVLSSAANGIWMCSDHADLIDKNSGCRFPVNTLLGWKALHEHRTSHEHSGRSAAYGFVRSLNVVSSSLFRPGELIELAKTTFIIGKNGSGKSAICEWLSVLDSPADLLRWKSGHSHEYRIGFDAPSTHVLRVGTGQGSISLSLDDMAVSVNHARSTVLYLRNRGSPQIRCDLLRLGALFGLDGVALEQLVGMTTSRLGASLHFTPYVPEVGEEVAAEDDDRQNLVLTMPDGGTRSYATLSGGEQSMLLLDLAISHAQSASRFAPTLLLVELKTLGIDWSNFQIYLDRLASAECAFQTVVTSWELPSDVERLGWQIYTLDLDTATGHRTIVATPSVPD